MNLDCDKCNSSPELKKVWGCTERAVSPQDEIEGQTRYIYLNCPLHFVPKSIKELLRMYKYHKDFPSANAPSYSRVSRRFLKAIGYYESKLAEYREKG